MCVCVSGRGQEWSKMYCFGIFVLEMWEGVHGGEMQESELSGEIFQLNCGRFAFRVRIERVYVFLGEVLKTKEKNKALFGLVAFWLRHRRVDFLMRHVKNGVFVDRSVVVFV